MPMYDYACGACGSSGETAVRLADYDPKGLPCPACGGMARRLIRPVADGGPSDTHPLVVDQIGRTFTSSRQIAEYERENPGVQINSATDGAWRKHKDRAREMAERACREAGYRDRDHRVASDRRERARERSR